MIAACALAITAIVSAALPPLPRDPATVTANDLFTFNKPLPDRSTYPPPPSPLPVVVSLGKMAWPLFDDEAKIVRAALKARLDKAAQEHRLAWKTIDRDDVYRSPSVHPKTGTQCAGRYIDPLGAMATAYAFASLDVVCKTTKLGDRVQHCDVEVHVRGPQGRTNAPYAELLRMHTKLAAPDATGAGAVGGAGARAAAGTDARAADVLVRAIERLVKVPSHAVDPQQPALIGMANFSKEKDPVPPWQTKLLQARVYRGADREGAVAPDGARLKLYNALLACRADESVSGSQTGKVRAARGDTAAAAATAFRCEDGTRDPPDSISTCVCKTIEPFVAQGERWSFEVRRPIEERAQARAFFLPDIISTTDERFRGHEVNQSEVHRCLAPVRHMGHVWRRQRVTINAAGVITDFEAHAEGSKLPNDVAACWDDVMRATKFGCPFDGKQATLDVVYHVFPYGDRKPAD